LAGEEKNALIFTFDITNQSSFRVYLKRAIRELIFSYEELNDSSKDKMLLPFLILGMKKDIVKERLEKSPQGKRRLS
jgi:GTPase SAR1 family protein